MDRDQLECLIRTFIDNQDWFHRNWIFKPVDYTDNRLIEL